MTRLAALLMVLLAAPAHAQQIEHVFRFEHPDPTGVHGYRFYAGTELVYDTEGPLVPDEDGVMTAILPLDPHMAWLVTATAYTRVQGHVIESRLSNQREVPAVVPEPPRIREVLIRLVEDIEDAAQRALEAVE